MKLVTWFTPRLSIGCEEPYVIGLHNGVKTEPSSLGSLLTGVNDLQMGGIRAEGMVEKGGKRGGASTQLN